MSARSRTHGLDELMRDLERVPVDGPPKFRAVVSKGALNVKTEWRRRWASISPDPGAHGKHLKRGINYDTEWGQEDFSAEIGVDDLNPQAPLAHFAEFGSIKNPPFPGGKPALDLEEPRFVDASGDVGVELLEGR